MERGPGRTRQPGTQVVDSYRSSCLPESAAGTRFALDVVRYQDSGTCPAAPFPERALLRTGFEGAKLRAKRLLLTLVAFDQVLKP